MLVLIIAAVIVAFILLFIFIPVVAWSILAFIALVLLVLLLIPVGAEFSYIEKKYLLNAKIGPFRLKLLPKEKKAEGTDESPKKPKVKKEKPASKETAKADKKLKLNFEEIMEILKAALKALSRFGKLGVHEFMLHYIAAGKDPYTTAMTYNYVNAGLSCLAPCCGKAFKVKGDVDVWTDINFTEETAFFETKFSVTLRLIQVLHCALVAAWRILLVLLKNKRRLHKVQKAAKAEDNITNNTQTEERMDSNG